jgi:hypothetical protein
MTGVIIEIFKVFIIVIVFIVISLPILMLSLCIIEQCLLLCGIECKLLRIFKVRGDSEYTELGQHSIYDAANIRLI